MVRIEGAGRHCGKAAKAAAAGGLRALAGVSAALAGVSVVLAAEGEADVEVAAQQLVVTGSTRAMQAQELPHALTSIGAQTLRSAGPMVNLSEAMAAVPGLVVNNRGNYAQDLQISARGFGARAPFGVRGLRIYADGIPATMPDGQGQVAHLDLAGAQRIEVLRGPFSVLYGNSSGGVIALYSAPATVSQTEIGLDLGSDGLSQQRLGVATPLGGGLDLRLNLSHLETNGFRPQSAAQRDLGNLRLGWQGEADRVTLLASIHRQQAQDPLGQTAADLANGRRTTNSSALLYNTRKDIAQDQLGLSWRHAFDEGGVLRESVVSGYAGTRTVTQFQAITPGAQIPAGSSGGVVDFERRYDGIDARLGWQIGAADLVTGLNYEDQRDLRNGYENFTGSGSSQVLGVQGRQRRQETNRATSHEAYAQLQAPLAERLALTGGVRGGHLRMRTDDQYLSNGDDSDALGYHYLTPVLGLRWTAQPGWTLHASVARGFESPTLGELAYRPASQTEGGFNRGLQGQTSRQLELGSKWRGRSVELDLALFHADTDHEIGVLSNNGGRLVYKDVGRTQRQGVELSGSWRLAPAWRVKGAATWLDAHYRDPFITCVAAQCNTSTPSAATAEVAAGNRIAGTVGRLFYAELAWTPAPWAGLRQELALEARAASAMAANDTNTDWAGGYALAHLRWRVSLPLGAADTLEGLLRVENLFDRSYVGSVIVNDGSRRFFESGVPRSLLASLRWQHRW